jgi:mono/diheme cytochrome c family protein
MKKNGISGTSVTLIGSLIFIVCTAFSVSWQSDPGELIYKQNCMRCHGADGTRGLFRAKNLKQSRLADSAVIQRLRNGKGIMPSFEKQLTPEEMNQVLIYLKLLRKD